MARNPEASKKDATSRLPPPPATNNVDDDPDNSDEKCLERWRKMVWLPFRDRAMKRVLVSAEKMPPTVQHQLKQTDHARSDERFSSIALCLSRMLALQEKNVQHAAARLLQEAFSPLRRQAALRATKFIPFELEQTLPAIMEAVALPDSEMRAILLDILVHVTSRTSAKTIRPAITKHILSDDVADVVKKALKVVMATGIDHASEAIPDIVGLLGHDDIEVRLDACRALATFGSEAHQAVRDLIRLVQFDEELRKPAILTLAAVVQDAQQISREMMDQGDRDALLSHLRAVGPGARSLRVRLQACWENEAATPGKNQLANQQAAGQDLAEANAFSLGDDFRCVNWNGKQYRFNQNQAVCVKILWENWKRGTPEVGGDYLLEKADVSYDRMSLLFRNNAAWKDSFIVAVPGKKNLYRLNLRSDS
jgi:hypothetical protein